MRHLPSGRRGSETDEEAIVRLEHHTFTFASKREHTKAEMLFLVWVTGLHADHAIDDFCDEVRGYDGDCLCTIANRDPIFRPWDSHAAFKAKALKQWLGWLSQCGGAP